MILTAIDGLAIALLQLSLGVRVFSRMSATAGGSRIEKSNEPHTGLVTVLVPVLNEAQRIESCLERLVEQPEEVLEIRVVDGGSRDGTQSLVGRFAALDPRVKLVDASPVPEDWTGKAWGLEVGLKDADARSQWVLCVDADVHVAPELVRSLLAHARKARVGAFSVAARQRLAGPLAGLLHPSFLTTLVYRFGIPGVATRNPAVAQCNGQCFFARRAVLLESEAFRESRDSLCEDFTVARRIASGGEAVGFYEAAGLVEVTMYAGAGETWHNWSRSLPTRDRYFGRAGWLRLLEVLFVQALPMPLLVGALVLKSGLWLTAVNAVLAILRLGVLAGTARAYVHRPWTYWFSFLLDLPVALKLFASALARHHTWRGRTYVRRKGGHFGLEGQP